jgi:hypothetical protein
VPENVMSMIAALIPVMGGLISFRAARDDRVAAAEALSRKLREPLIQAAFNRSCPADIARAA